MVIIIYGWELIRECFFDFISNDKQIVSQKVILEQMYGIK